MATPQNSNSATSVTAQTELEIYLRYKSEVNSSYARIGKNAAHDADHSFHFNELILQNSHNGMSSSAQFDHRIAGTHPPFS